MKRSTCVALGLMLAPAPLLAQDIVAAGSRYAPGVVLPRDTEVTLALEEELSSKRVREGQSFRVTVARDVILGDHVVIPRGTPGRGRVTRRTGKGLLGKSGRVEFEITSVEVNGTPLPLSGHHRIDGGGGIVGGFVTGRPATATQASEWKARTRHPFSVAFAGA